jgi:uncharacterized RDD family membrane protein YckC
MTKPGFLRYFAVIIYDIFLLVALLFFATAILLPFNGGKAISNHIFYSLYLLLVSFLFYGWFWTHGGQTLGLKAWKIKVLTESHGLMGWQQAFIRFIVAITSWSILGLGFAWSLVDKKQRSWHDLASKTGLFMEPTNPMMCQPFSGHEDKQV